MHPWTRLLLKLLHMQTNQIAMLHGVAQLGQPQRIAPRPTSDVGDYRRWGRKLPLQNLSCTLELDCTCRVTESVPLLTLRVVRPQLGIFRAHGSEPVGPRGKLRGVSSSGCRRAASRPSNENASNPHRARTVGYSRDVEHAQR